MRARSGSKPRAIRRRWQVRGRFHCRHRMQRNRRRGHSFQAHEGDLHLAELEVGDPATDDRA